MSHLPHYSGKERARPQIDPFLEHYPSVTRRELGTMRRAHTRAAVAAAPISWTHWPFAEDVWRTEVNDPTEATPAYWLVAIAAAVLLLGTALNAGGWLP